MKYQNCTYYICTMCIFFYNPIHSVVFASWWDTYPSVTRETIHLKTEIQKSKGKSFVALSQGTTHYELIGHKDNPMVVLVHGATLSMWVWDRQVEPLVQAGYRVLRYDYYGRGLSENIKIKYTRTVYFQQLSELIDALDIRVPVNLVGHSFGGTVISFFTSKNPHKVHKIIYISPGVKIGKISSLLLRSPAGKYIVHKTLGNLPGKIDQRFIQMRIPLHPYKEKYLKQLHYVGFQASVYSLYAHALGDYRPYYKETGNNNRPVLLLWGNKDS